MRDFLKKIVVAILTWESRLILKKYKPKIVAVTGSVGKTSAKDAIALVLGQSIEIRKSQKSYNSELGVPLTIIGAETGWHSVSKWLDAIAKGLKLILFREKYPKLLVLEIGADRPGDIQKIRTYLKPDIAVITALQPTPVHVEFFSGPEEVFREKFELVKDLGPDDTVLLNSDDEEIMKIREKISAKILTFGFSKKADFSGSKYEIFTRKEGRMSVPEGMEFKVKHLEEEYPVKILNTFGKHQIYAALAALGCGLAMKIKLEDAVSALSRFESPPGRLNLIRGLKDSYVLDDTYNSSPKALLASLEVLRALKAKRRIAVLGDMTELGRFTIPAHREIGEKLSKYTNILFIVGVRSKFFAEGAIASGFIKENIFYFNDSAEAGIDLERKLESGDLILVKGSQSMRMEKVVEQIMAEPERKSGLLVRQEEEWKKI